MEVQLRFPLPKLAGAHGRAIVLAAALSFAPVGAAAGQSVGKVAEIVRIDGPIAQMKLGLHHVEFGKASERKPIVLILHGTNLSQAGNAAYPFGGRSMMDALAERGADVWGLDFYGFGDSDRYPQMSQRADQNPALGQAPENAAEVASVVDFLRRTRSGRPIIIVGDSGGSLIAGIFATQSPDKLDGLVQFGPVTVLSSGAGDGTPPAYRLITPDRLWAKFKEWSEAAGDPPALDDRMYDAWAKAVLDSDPESRTRTPPSVKIPNGRAADGAAIASGHFPYDPAKITVPTLIVMGETDQVATFPGAQWLLGSLRHAPWRRLVVIGHASHTIQYEAERGQLYKAISDFVDEVSHSPGSSH